MHVYPKSARLKLWGGSMLVGGVLFFLVSLVAGEDDLPMMVFMGLLGVFVAVMGIFILRQGTNRNPVLTIADEGITFRHYPGFEPLFCAWDDIFAVSMGNGFGGDVIIVTPKNPHTLFLQVKGGFIQRNHARNGMRQYGTPIVIFANNLETPYIIPFKEMYNRVEARRKAANG